MHGKKLLRTLSLSFCSLICLSSLASASEQGTSEQKYELAYKFKMGEVIRYAVRHTEHLRTSMEGTTQEAETKSESIKAWKVTDVLPNGEMEFIHLVESIRLSNRVPNRAEVSYNSEGDETPPAGYEPLARSIGVPISLIRIDSNGAVVHREEKHPQQAASEDMPLVMRLPTEPIAIGEQWDNKYDVQVQRRDGTTKTIRTRRVCTLEKVDSGQATIAVEYQILSLVEPFFESQLAERLSKGVVQFDLKRGRIVSQRLDVDKSIIGFYGESSRKHVVSRLEEKLLKPGQRVAKKKSKSNK